METDPALPDTTLLAEAAHTLSMLASVPRMSLIWLLSRDVLDVNTLAARIGASPQSVSQHLGKMRLAGIVSARQEGKRHLYTVEDPHIVSLVDLLIDHHLDLREKAANPGPPR